MTKLNLRIATPDSLIFEGLVESVRAFGAEGSFSILPKHAPMIVTLKECEVVFKEDEEKLLYAVVEGGILEVSDNKVNILSQSAMLAEEKDLAAIKLEFEKHQREERNALNRARMLASEMKLRKLLRKISDYDSR